MPSLSELPGEIKQNRFCKALQRVGFEINKVGGNGSHFKAIWPRNQKSVTIPFYLPKQTLKYVLKELEEISEVDWNQIKKEL
ncbi:MAG: type II toxin-antitoxin system HicA family toxin [Patescibacteria group bacterium]